MQLILVGPRGSAADSDWLALALSIERDDRVARKLVWLLPDTPEEDGESYDQFIKRTFLAKPWSEPDQLGNQALDKLSDANVKVDGLSHSLVDEWKRIALDQEKTPDEIVEALVKAWEVRDLI
ncbi:hypothetical protein GCM10027277_34960 [Pseudoduganella ginsengisoli]